MLLKLFLAFTLIPVIEIFLLMQLSAFLGPFTAILLVIATGFAGASLAKLQGLQTMIRVQENLNQGIMPGDEIIDALLILIAGIVLITPGLLTDIAGILLLIPGSRQHVKNFLKREFKTRMNNGSIRIHRH